MPASAVLSKLVAIGSRGFLTTDGAGNVYVNSSSQVAQFDGSGNLLTTWGGGFTFGPTLADASQRRSAVSWRPPAGRADVP